MKNLLLTFSLVSLFFVSNAQEQDGKGPKLVCSDVLEYGTVDLGSDGLRSLMVKNEGDAPLVISSVGSSCGCTVPSWPKEPILPGQEAKIEVRYNTNIQGKISKSITISSNSIDQKMKYVRLNGEVIKKN